MHPKIRGMFRVNHRTYEIRNSEIVTQRQGGDLLPQLTYETQSEIRHRCRALVLYRRCHQCGLLNAIVGELVPHHFQ